MLVETTDCKRHLSLVNWKLVVRRKGRRKTELEAVMSRNRFLVVPHWGLLEDVIKSQGSLLETFSSPLLRTNGEKQNF